MTTLLIVDDDAAVHDSVEAPLRGTVDQFLHARLPEEGLRLALSMAPDVILLDVNMPVMDGLKLCRLLKETANTRDIPILFLTVERNMQNLARAFDVGGSDYILKPFHAIELRARVKTALRAKEAVELLKEQARIDALTGLANRAAFESSLGSACAAHERTGSPVSLLLFDLDDFKRINDSYGHGVGDEALRRVGACLRETSRPYDTPCRYGGDEFVVLLGQTEGHNARRAGERLLEAIRCIELETLDTCLPIRASGGLASSTELRPGFASDDLLKAADRALYAAKRSGGDRLINASQIDDD